MDFYSEESSSPRIERKNFQKEFISLFIRKMNNMETYEIAALDEKTLFAV